MLIALVAVNAAVCIAGLCVHSAVTWHLREQHPLVWNGFRFPRGSPLVTSAEEGAENFAQIGLSEYLRSGAWRNLGDPRLERLIRARRLCFYAVCLTMTGTFVALLVSTR